MQKYNVISIFKMAAKVKVYQQTKFCRHTSIVGWDITTSVFEKQTSAILEIYFRFRRFWPFARNLHIILHQATEFRPNRSTTAEIWRYIHCSRWRPQRLNTTSGFVSVDVIPSEGQSLLANQILLRYLKWWLRYNYFRFRNTHVLHIGILLPVSILTISP